MSNIQMTTMPILPEDAEADLERAHVRTMLARKKDDTIACTIENCVTILQNDPLFKNNIRKNLHTGCINIYGNMPWHRDGRMLSDEDLPFIKVLFEKYYGIMSEAKVMSALRIVANRNGFHPIRERLNSLTWDGTPRIRYALHHFLGAEVNDFNEECLRVFMLGAATRVFRPGQKFDLMLCLTGGQGAGKSTFFRYLALDDEWFSDDLNKLEDANIYRRLMGHWIIEMSEMMATINAQSVEIIKSFLTRQKDTYKTPYDKFPVDHPRQCVFGGTTNKHNFLPNDRTGNRRFMPIRVNTAEAEVHILEDKAASRTYFEQMWAEIMVIYNSGDFSLTLSKEAAQRLRDEQQEYMPEDTQLGQLVDFLEHTQYDTVCSRLLYAEAFNNGIATPQDRETRNICELMNTAIENGDIKGWKPYKNPRHFAKYGKQRGWERVKSRQQETGNEQSSEQLKLTAVEKPDDCPF